MSPALRVPDGARLAGGAAEAPGGASRRQSWIAGWWPVVVPVVVVLLGAWLYRWVDEDAFIDFRIIDNLVAGHGLVYNIGERVEVTSDPLWVFTLTGLHEVLPFVSLEWLSVLLGLLCTAGGFLAGGRAVQQLGRSRREDGVFPLGLLMVSVVAGVWEFATSGLEMSMVFLWLGLSFAALVRVERRRGRPAPAGVLVGLGVLIRPELALMSVVLLGALLVMVCSPGWSPGRSRVRRGLGVAAAAMALPLAYQLFRMSYFALLAPNTGLAKVAGSAWWSQGLTYLWNFVSPYTLWLPLLLAVPFVAVRVATWWARRRPDRGGGAGGSHRGRAGRSPLRRLRGRRLHARPPAPAGLLRHLPAGHGVASPAPDGPGRPAGRHRGVGGRGRRLAPVRPPRVTGLNPQTVFISNERNSWIDATHDAHPVTAGDYRHALSGRAGARLAALARGWPPAGSSWWWSSTRSHRSAPG